MAGITLVSAQAQLDAWTEASIRVAQKQSYSINGRSLTLADAADIEKMITFWEAKVNKLSRNGRGGLRYGVPA